MQRKYFGTDGIRGRTGIAPINAEFALKLGWAVGQVLGQGSRSKVLIGKDTRLSGYLLSSALEAGFISSGLDVILLGPMPTPAVAYLTRELNAEVGVVVSASHNPYYDNGIKFFGKGGRKLPDSIESEIEALLSNIVTTVEPDQLGRASMMPDASLQYIEFCKEAFLKPYSLRGMKIVVDCANGANYHIGPLVLTELGATVITLHAEPDGFNINAECGSTHPSSLQKAVLENQADIGIAFDGDGDRVILVDHLGELVDGDELLFIIAKGYHDQGLLKGGVVGTQMSNLGLENAFKMLNIPFMRTKVGDRYVMDALLQTGWQLGGEGSGHIICLDKTSTGDGIISALQVLGQVCHFQRNLHDLKKGMNKCFQILLNVTATNGINLVQDDRIQNAVLEAEKDLQTQGRVLLRPSGTEPCVRVMVEGEDQALISQVAQKIATVVSDVAQNLQMLGNSVNMPRL